MNSKTMVVLPDEPEPITALYDMRTKQKHELPGRKTVVLGRDFACDIRLHDSTVSRCHCELRFVNGMWWVEDLNSTNGIAVNDVSVRCAPLLAGMRLQLGKATMYVVGGASVFPLQGKSITSFYTQAYMVYGSDRAAAEKLRRASRSGQGPSSATVWRKRDRGRYLKCRKGDKG